VRRQARARDNGGDGIRQVLIEQLDFTGREIVRLHCRVEEDMRCGPGGCGMAFALEIGDRLDVVAHPQLGRGEFDGIVQEHLPSPACREIGDHGSGRGHVKAASDHGLEQLEAGLEQLLWLQPVLVKGATMVGEPHLAIDG
jgi:hypothetical protein